MRQKLIALFVLHVGAAVSMGPIAWLLLDPRRFRIRLIESCWERQGYSLSSLAQFGSQQCNYFSTSTQQLWAIAAAVVCVLSAFQAAWTFYLLNRRRLES